MKVKVNTRRRENTSLKALHSTVQQNISKTSSVSSIKGIAGKLRSLSVVLSDIAKEKDLLTHQGWESVGPGLWKFKSNDFQHATRHIKSRRKPTMACVQGKNVVALKEPNLRRTLSVEGISVVSNLRSKRHAGDEKKTHSSFIRPSDVEVVKSPINEQRLSALKIVRGSGTGFVLQESKAKDIVAEKSIKVNLLRQKIGPSGEMGWRVRRRESFQKDSVSPDSTRMTRRLSVELLESGSNRQKRDDKGKIKENSGGTVVSVSVGYDKVKESSNKVVLGPLKRTRSSADISSNQGITGLAHARKTRRESMGSSTKKLGIDNLNNGIQRVVSSKRELRHSHSTKVIREDESGECLKASLNPVSSRSSKVKPVAISSEPKTAASTRSRRCMKEKDMSLDVPKVVHSHHARNKPLSRELVARTSDERKSIRLSLKLENGRRRVKSQNSPRLVRSASRASRKEVRKEQLIENRQRGIHVQKQAKNLGSESKNVESSNRIIDKKILKSDEKSIMKSAGAGVKKLTCSGKIRTILGKRQMSVVKEERKGTEISCQQEPSEDSDRDEVRIPRKRSNKVQLEWCQYCGLQLDSVENRLEHEFTHEEPRKLQVSLHLCSLNTSSVKLPVYVDLDEVAALKSPPEDDCSPYILNERPTFDTDDVLNEDECMAYGDSSENVNIGEACNQGGKQRRRLM